MVNREISINQSWREVTGPTTNRRRVGAGRTCGCAWPKLGVLWKRIEYWVHNYMTHGSVDPPSGLRRRPWVINTQAVDDLLKLIQETAENRFFSKWGEIGWFWLDFSVHRIARSALLVCDKSRTIGLVLKLCIKLYRYVKNEWILRGILRKG